MTAAPINISSTTNGNSSTAASSSFPAGASTATTTKTEGPRPTAAAAAAAAAVAAVPPSRTVARPLANLGNTCYVNAVLQALAHAPELCLAMDVQPHSHTCPIAKANKVKAAELRKKKSPSSSPDGLDGVGGGGGSSSNGRVMKQHQQGVRKSRRSGRKSPDSDTGSLNDAASNKNNVSSSDYCALCEFENHIHQVHNSTTTTSSSSSSVGGGSAGINIGGAATTNKPYAPNSFVNGFIEHVAPWFKLGVQEDSHEFLRLLIEAMQKSCRLARPSSSTTSQATAGEEDNNNDQPRLSPDNPQDDTAADNNSPPAPTTTTAAKTTTSTGVVSEQDKEYPFSLFRGVVESKVRCESCKACSDTHDPIEDIGLEVTPMSSSGFGGGGGVGDENSGSTPSFPISSNAASVSSSRNSSPTPMMHLADVQTAFTRFARAEDLDCGYKCEKCGNVGRATKQSRLASIPPILTLHLKRFRYGSENIDSTNQAHAQGGGGGGGGTSAASAVGNLPMRTTRSAAGRGSNEVNQLYNDFGISKTGSAKIEGHIHFKTVFDLKPYLTDDLQQKTQSSFCRLFAVLVHAGKNSHSGHYIAYVRSLNKNVNKNEWWKLDDGRKNLVSENEVLAAEAYMLFYRVVKHPVTEEMEQIQKQIQRRQIEEAQARAKSETPAPATAGTGDKVKKEKSTKKRATPSCAFLDTEDWAHKKTRIPPHLLGAVKRAEEVVGNDIVGNASFSSDCLEELQDLCDQLDLMPSTPGTVSEDDDDTAKGPMTRSKTAAAARRRVVYEEDVVGGTDPYRHVLSQIFYRLSKRVANSSTSWLDGNLVTDMDPQQEHAPPPACSDDEEEREANAAASTTTTSTNVTTNLTADSNKAVDIIVEPETAVDVLL